jgi:hypothetical protein
MILPFCFKTFSVCYPLKLVNDYEKVKMSSGYVEFNFCVIPVQSCSENEGILQNNKGRKLKGKLFEIV